MRGNSGMKQKNVSECEYMQGWKDEMKMFLFRITSALKGSQFIVLEEDVRLTDVYRRWRKNWDVAGTLGVRPMDMGMGVRKGKGKKRKEIQ
jgi:hypothetical protein